jgi:hypothetical protein
MNVLVGHVIGSFERVQDDREAKECTAIGFPKPERMFPRIK